MLTSEIGFVGEWIVGWPGWNWGDQLGGDCRVQERDGTGLDEEGGIRNSGKG